MPTPILVSRSWEDALRIAAAAAVEARKHERFVYQLMPPLVLEAMRYRIDPAVILGQSIHETGWGQFGGVVPASYHNTCGLKTGPGGSNDDADAHQRFPNWPTGARAHAQHLLAYVGKPHHDLEVDPRAGLVRDANQQHGAVTSVEELGGRWAPSDTYGQRIAEKAQLLLDKAGLA